MVPAKSDCKIDSLRYPTVGKGAVSQLVLLILALVCLFSCTAPVSSPDSQPNIFADSEVRQVTDRIYRKDEESARKTVEVIKAKHNDLPTLAKCKWLEGRIAFESGSNTRAIECFRAAIAANPNCPQFYADLISSLFEQGNWTESAELRDKCNGRWPDQAEFIERSGANVSPLQKKYETLKQQLRNDENNDFLRLELIGCSLSISKDEALLQMARLGSGARALAAERGYPIYCARFCLIPKQINVQQAIEQVESCRTQLRAFVRNAIATGMDSAARTAAQIYCKRFEATTEMLVVRDADPSTQTTCPPLPHLSELDRLHLQAYYFVIKGQREKAAELLLRAAELAPDRVEAWRRLANNYSAMEKWQELETSASRCAALRPQRSDMMIARVEALAHQNRLREAAQQLDLAYSIDPYNARVVGYFYFLATLYKSAGDLASAKKYAIRATEMCNDNTHFLGCFMFAADLDKELNPDRFDQYNIITSRLIELYKLSQTKHFRPSDQMTYLHSAIAEQTKNFAHGLLAHGKASHAEKLFLVISQLEPTPENLVLLGITYLNENKTQNAIPLLAKLKTLSAQWPQSDGNFYVHLATLAGANDDELLLRATARATRLGFANLSVCYFAATRALSSPNLVLDPIVWQELRKHGEMNHLLDFSKNRLSELIDKNATVSEISANFNNIRSYFPDKEGELALVFLSRLPLKDCSKIISSSIEHSPSQQHVELLKIRAALLLAEKDNTSAAKDIADIHKLGDKHPEREIARLVLILSGKLTEREERALNSLIGINSQ